MNVLARTRNSSLLVRPNECAENVVIALTGDNNPSCLVSNCLPDLHFVGDSQCSPLY